MNDNIANPEVISIIEKYVIPTESRSSTNERADENNDESYNIDQFGFYHQDEIQEKNLTNEERQRQERRLIKWQEMTRDAENPGSNWHRMFQFGNASEKLSRRIFKGIPPQFRMKVWPLLLYVAESIKKHKDVYTDMVNRALHSSSHLEQIDKDVNRTFRNTTFFRIRYGSRQQALFRILAAYSVYNAELGYCQGMSEIVGMLLTYIAEEEEAFWALAELMSGWKYKMHGLFVRDFPGLYRLFNHHERITRRLLPSVHKHFTKQDLVSSTYALKWFMQCFIDRLPFSLVLRLWDIYLLQGEWTLPAMAHNILKMHKKRILKMDQAQLTCFFQDDLAHNFQYDDNTVIDSLKDCFEHLNRTKLNRLPPPTKVMLPPRSCGSYGPESIWLSQSALGLKKHKSDALAYRKGNQPAHNVVSGLSGHSWGHTSSTPTTDTLPHFAGPDKTRQTSAPPISPSYSTGFAKSASIVTVSAFNNRLWMKKSPPPATNDSGYPLSDILDNDGSNFFASSRSDSRVSGTSLTTSSSPTRIDLSPSSSTSIRVSHPSPKHSPRVYTTVDSRRHRTLRASQEKPPLPDTASQSYLDRSAPPRNGVTLLSVRPRQMANYSSQIANMAGALHQQLSINDPAMPGSENRIRIEYQANDRNPSSILSNDTSTSSPVSVSSVTDRQRRSRYEGDGDGKTESSLTNSHTNCDDNTTLRDGIPVWVNRYTEPGDEKQSQPAIITTSTLKPAANQGNVLPPRLSTRLNTKQTHVTDARRNATALC